MRNNSAALTPAGANATKIFIGTFFAVTVICPLVTLLVRLGQADFKKIFSSPLVGQSVVHSVLVSLTATAISVTLAFLLAWCMARTRAYLKPLFRVLLIVPMLVPSISHGTGLVTLFGTNGRLTRLFGLTKDIYGFWGIVIGSVMYSFPVAYLMIYDIFRYENAAPYEAATVLGIPKLRRFTAITFPYLRKPLINVIFATFTMIVTDYGVPLMVGGNYKTLPYVMYEEVIHRLDFNKGAVFSAMLLLPAVLAFFADMFCKNRANGIVTKPFNIQRKPLRDILSTIFLAIISFAVVYPNFTFAQMMFMKKYPVDMSFTLEHIKSTIGKGALNYLGNSVFIAVMVSILGTAVAFISAYLTTRFPSKTSKLLHLLSITSLAIPGLVLGLSYAMTFKGTFIYDTFAILIFVNCIHFFSSPYLMFYNSLGKLSPDLEAVGATLGAGRLRMIRDVFIPTLRSTFLESFAYFFVNCMMTISAVSFLANAETYPVALMLNRFEGLVLLEAAAFVSLMILGVNLAMKGIIALVKKLSSRRSRKA